MTETLFTRGSTLFRKQRICFLKLESITADTAFEYLFRERSSKVSRGAFLKPGA